ncbi:ABC transporter ATP-binding protein [Primorskyibacter sp. S87]|uniref:ABC transporter ATP-binding protein n=1 Tax=Primorskyibacter sp. S87 TaxID=3415126 RepID=UPI003C7BF816
MTRASPGLTIEGSASLSGDTLFAPLRLDLVPGGWTCLLGGSGVGKSTLLRLIAELPTGAEFSGTIAASDGAPATGRVAYMAQDDLLLPWATVAENVALGARLRGELSDPARRDRMLHRVGLAAHANKTPSQLSGGQRQRVALARTLMEDKEIILLDEPFSALDAATRADMQGLAAELLTGRTVLLVTHDPAEAARLGHHIAVMRPGGLTHISAPSAMPPRNVDDEETLHLQGTLLKQLMSGGAI